MKVSIRILFLLWAFAFVSQPDGFSSLWCKIQTDDPQKQIVLKLRERNLHRIPQILVYSKVGTSKQQFIGKIDLKEDNRNKLKLQYKWINPNKLELSINCDYCMIEKRMYYLDIDKKSINASNSILIASNKH